MHTESTQDRPSLDTLQNAVQLLRDEIKKLIVGQSQMIDLLITALLANGHVLIEGVPGIAKTLTAKLLAKTLTLKFSRIQFTPDLMPSDVIGTSVFNPKKVDFEFKEGPIFANMVLIDEINRAPAKTQAALFEVMEERQITADGNTYSMKPPFFVVATQNPIEHEGTYRLPEAQLDRFLFKIVVSYPSLEEETEIISSFHERKDVNDLSTINSLLEVKDILEHQKSVSDIHVEHNLIKYIAALVLNSRSNPNLYLGGSPRASLALLTSSKALAAVRGRDFVTPEDIQEVAYPVLRHRIMLTPEKEMEGSNPDKIIKEIIEQIEVPR